MGSFTCVSEMKHRSLRELDRTRGLKSRIHGQFPSLVYTQDIRANVTTSLPAFSCENICERLEQNRPCALVPSPFFSV